jgi:uncharacterized protein YndB with AHSA1/START domain
MTERVVTSVTVEIEAPAAFVWDVLVDYARYPDWNPYTIAATTTLEIGTPIELTLPNPDGSDTPFTTTEYIRVVDPPHHLRYDSGEEYAGVLGVRDQLITELGPDHCSYRTTDALSGEHVELAIEMTGDWMRAGFDSVAHALKARAESLYA